MWPTTDITVNGVCLSVMRTGGGGPPLVLAHGVTDDGAAWTPIAAELQREYDIIMYDARGHGGSQRHSARFGLPELAADLAGLIEALALNLRHQPLVMGHSMGAITALAMAGLYPGLARAIVLEDPPQWFASAPLLQPAAGALHADLAAFFGSLEGKTLPQLRAEKHEASPLWSEMEVNLWCAAKLRADPGLLRWMDADPFGSVDWPAILPAVDCPALLLTGDPALGGLVTPEGAAELQQRVPSLRVVHIPVAGHCIRREQPAAFLAAVREFLSGV